MASRAVNTKKDRKPRKDCIYSQAEMLVLRTYKDRYQAQTTREKCMEYVQHYILPGMFNYWTDNKTILISENEIQERTTVSLSQLHSTFTTQLICVGSVQMALEQLVGNTSDHAKWRHL